MKDELLTEAVLESTRDLDQRSTREVLDAIHGQDRVALDAVGRALPEIERAVEILVLCLQGGGRWFNVGAGTSGRVGALDASEVPPTFGYPADRVRAVIAGGEPALLRAVEGAEDDGPAARRALRELELMPGDAVVALSASGSTPFAIAALEEAFEIGARRIAITCNPDTALAEHAEVAIEPLVGPEVIAGSTRMKGGLAQKMILHLLSTTVMVRLGRVEGNLMTNLMPASRKLRGRALRILIARSGLPQEEAEALLDAAHGSVAAALAQFRSGDGLSKPRHSPQGASC
ncbi:MAG: N-acetylmuramic acid 6-phosphate etherase [Myxococcota bacterium]